MGVEMTESWLSTETGLSREVLRGVREKKLRGADWTKGTRSRIVWALSALERVAEDYPELGALAKKIKGGGAAAETVEKALAPVEVCVVRKFANPRLIEALHGSDEAIHVRVHDSKNFIPGMVIKAVPPKVKGTPWILEGRCPRWLGRM